MTTTTNFEPIAAVDLDGVTGGCKQHQMQQQAYARPQFIPQSSGDGPIDVAVDYNAQAQTQTA